MLVCIIFLQTLVKNENRCTGLKLVIVNYIKCKIKRCVLFLLVNMSLQNIIRTLGVKQINRLVDLRPEEMRKMDDDGQSNKKCLAPEFLGANCEGFDKLFVEDDGGSRGSEGRGSGGRGKDKETSHDGDLIMELIKVINPKFAAIGNQKAVVKELRNNLAFDLERLKLYTKFGYGKDTGFVKRKVYDTLINKDLPCKPAGFGDVFISVVKYLVDYFDINIIVYNCNYNMEKCFSTDIWYSRRGGERKRIGKDLPVIEFIYTTKFIPLVDEDGCGVKRWNPRIEKVFQSEKFNLIDYKAMSGYKVAELSNMAEENKIELKKVSDKTGKLIKKSKKDLYEDLYYIVDL